MKWAKVELLKRTGNKSMWQLPPPFDRIKQGTAGTILGEEISANGSLTKEVAARIAKAQNTWRIVNIRLLRNKVINPRIKIMIWNSLIRGRMVYGLRTKELPRNLPNQLETYMYKHIRTMMDPWWKDEAWYRKRTNCAKQYNNRQWNPG